MLNLLRWLLAKDPEQRPSSAREVAIALASIVPAIPPHVPSGADILAKIAPEFVTNASPLDGTVRNRGGDRATPAAILWSPQGTRIPDLPVGTPPGHFSVARPEMQAPTVSQRPVVPIALANPTPALPFAGPGPVVPAARTSAGKIVALGVACALVVGVSTFLIVSAHKRHAATPNSVPADAGITRIDGAAVAPVILPAATIDAGGLTDVRDASASAPLDAATVRAIDAGVNPSHTHTSPPNHTSIHRGSDALPSAGSAAHNGSGKKFDPDAVED